MNKKLIALAVSGAALSTSATAVELYNNDGTTFSMGGHVAVSLKGNGGDVYNEDAEAYESGNTNIISNSPRINFTGTQDLGNGWEAEAKGEWGMKFVEGGESTFSTRLGYIALKNAEAGNVTVGTQWSPYSAIATVADKPIAFANDFAYDNHGNLGTGRANSMISYTNGFDINETVALNGGLGWQGSTGDYSDRVQLTLALDVSDFTIGYAYNTGDRDDLTSKETAVSNVISAKYGSYGNGLYVAGVYAMNEYMNGTSNYNTGASTGEVLEESDAYEFIVAYALSNSLNLSVNYEALNDTKASETVYSHSAIQAEYNFTPKFVGFAGYQFDLGSDVYSKENDMWNMGVRYYL
jgi:predicted porin